MKKLFPPLLLFFLLTGCQNEKKPLQFQELAIEKTDRKNCNPEKENCTYISIHIPQAQNPDETGQQINSAIQKHVIDLINYKDDKTYESLEGFSENFINDYESTLKEFPEENIPWEANVDGKVVYKSENNITLRFNLDLFTGGAHGYSSISYLNFNPQTGKLYSKTDLFKPGFKKYAEALFKKKYNIPASDNINSTGFFFKNDEFHLPENIGFEKNKIILQYNAYEVASYAQGSLKLEVQKKDVQKFLKLEQQ